jgi:hypothetical protein
VCYNVSLIDKGMNMAGKATSVYLSVVDKKTHITSESRKFFKMAELNAYISTEEFKEKYPLDVYYIVKETY